MSNSIFLASAWPELGCSTDRDVDLTAFATYSKMFFSSHLFTKKGRADLIRYTWFLLSLFPWIINSNEIRFFFSFSSSAMHSRKSSKLVLQTANCLKKDFERLSLTSPAIRVIIKTDRVMDVPKGSCTHYLMCSR